VIQGTVIDIKGKPVPGVDVEADGEWPNEFREAGLIGIGDSITRSVVTDSGGTFTIRALPAGDYGVYVARPAWPLWRSSCFAPASGESGLDTLQPFRHNFGPESQNSPQSSGVHPSDESDSLTHQRS
jgi:protocatechuate 3,4-dioxygenase beta subunit